MRIRILLASLVLASVSFAQPAINGRDIPADFCRVSASQSNYTGFGDNYSELNELYAYHDGVNLYIGATGNLEGNGNNIHLYIETGRSSSNSFSLTSGCFNCSVHGMSGVTFDLNPDWALGISHFNDGTNDNIYLDLHDLVNNASTYLGSAFVNIGDGTLGGGDNSAGVLAALDNTNFGGITGDPGNPGSPAGVSTGVEVAIPLSSLGYSGGPIRVFALVTGGADLGDPNHGTYLSNQSLPAMNAGDPGFQFNNPAWSRFPDPPFISMPLTFAEAPGEQAVTVRLLGDTNGDGCIDDADLLMVLFAFGSGDEDADINCSGIVDDADLLIVLFGFGSGC
jgi:hypothetical protein